MKSDLKTRHGGKILADALAAQGVKLVFGVPGESYLPVLDGLHDLSDRIKFVICRQEGGARLQRWIEGNGLGVGTSFRCQDLFDNRSASYVGDVGIGINPKLAERVKGADVLLVIGARLGEMTTSAYSLVEAPVPKQTLIHVHAGAEELGRVYRPALAINSGMVQFIEALERVQLKNPAWRERTATARKEFLEWTEPRPMPGTVQYGEVIRW